MAFPDGVRYEIYDDQAFMIEMWDDENPDPEGRPFMRQPWHPDGREWADRADAQAWVDERFNQWRNPPEPDPIPEPPVEE